MCIKFAIFDCVYNFTIMDNQAIINEAEKLIEEGFNKFENANLRQNKYYEDLKYYYCYGDARDLLLKHAYEDDLNEVLQQAYYDLIPPTISVLHEQETSFKTLFDSDPEVRIKTAKYLCRQPLAEYANSRKNWLKHPKVTEVLIKALDDTEPKVVRDVFIALAGNYQRYFKDSRIYPAIRRFYTETDNKELQIYFYYWINVFDNDERWDYIIPKLQQKQSQKLLHALLSNGRKGTADDEFNLKLQPILLDLLKQKLSKENESSVYHSILTTLTNNETIDNFQKLVDLKKNKTMADRLQKTINMNLSREQIDYMTEKLFSQ